MTPTDAYNLQGTYPRLMGHPSSFRPCAERGQASRSGKDGVWSLGWLKRLKRSSQVWEQIKDRSAVALWWTLGSCSLSHISK